MKPIKNHANEKYGRLKVVQFVKRENKKSYWKCKCDCGNEIILPIAYLTTGDTKSCGCLRKEKAHKTGKKSIKHKMTNTRLYSIWSGIKQRCYNTKKNNYKYYGAKAITICDEWKNDFVNFYNWAMSYGYKNNLTIDRIDNNKGYFPENCRWVTILEQNNNTSRNHKIEYKGKKYNSMSSFCREMGIDYNKFRQKIREGYTIKVALNFSK